MQLKKKSGKVKLIFKTILVLFLVLVFFEMGLIGSYTIVTSKVPDIEMLVDLQVKSVLDVFSFENLNKTISKGIKTYQITNSEDVAKTLKNLTGLDGINIHDMNATSIEDLKSGKTIDIKIEVLGYSPIDSKSDQITLSQTPDVRLVASAKASPVNNKVKIDIFTIQVISTAKINNS
jgi:replication initiation and membrane attachment protein DnaB